MNQLIYVRQIHQVIAAVLLVVAATLPIASWANSVRNPEGRSHPSAEQSILHQVNDCADLRAFATESLVDSLLNLVFCWWDRPWNQPGGEGVGALDFTGTNNQEEGVDELDIIKTDGNFIYVARDDSVAILRSWPPEGTEILSETPLDGFTSGIFLHGDRLAAISQLWSGIGGGSFQRGGTRIDLFDVEDRSKPLRVRSIEMEGFLVGSRLLDGKMYLVLHTWIPMPIAIWELLYRDDLELPELDPSAPPEEIEETLELARQILTPLVAEIVAKMDISEILPLMTDTADESPEPTLLLQCTDILQPSVRDQYSVLSVVSIDLASGDWTTSPVDATAVLTSGWTVYASRNTLYVAQGSSWWWGPAFEVDGETTAIHSFDLGSGEDDPVEYRASGEVPGRLPNQFSMSEYEGALRVASCHSLWAWGPETDEPGTVVTVMRDNGAGFLQTIGQIGGIAPGENLYAARFLGERGYLVTFEIIDPLFTLDLADPTEPRLTGELKIPGYSAYLHPMDHNHLLAIGMNGDDEGRLHGLAVKIFDVADLENPSLLHDYVLESPGNDWSWSEALADHHAFTFRNDVLSLPAVQGSWSGNLFAGLLLLSVDLDDGIEELGRVNHDDLPTESSGDWGWSALVRRSLFIEDNVYSLSRRGMKVNNLYDPEIEYAAVPFNDPEPEVSPLVIDRPR